MAGSRARKIKRLPRGEFSSRQFKTVRTPYFLVKVKRNEGEYGRIGVVAGKAAGKTAVERIFLKRQARAELSKAAVSGNDILIVFSPAARSLTRKNLHTELTHAIRKAQL